MTILDPPATVSAPHPVHRRHLPGGAIVAEHRWTPTAGTLAVHGEIDGFDAPAIIDLITGCLLDHVVELDLDLDGVTFADLTVLRAIARAERFGRRAGVSVRVRNAGPAIARLHALVWDSALVG